MTLPTTGVPASFAGSFSPWPHRLAWLLACTVFPLIWLGGTVTTYEAGMAIPDWPTTYSYWFYPITLWLAVWDVFLEHGHRLLAQFVGILAILLAVSIWRLDGRKWMRWLALVVLLGVLLQCTLGGLRVLNDSGIFPLVSGRTLARIHGCTATLYFGLCTTIVSLTSRTWRLEECHAAIRSATGVASYIKLAWLVTAAIYLEIILGAQLRRPSADASFGGADLWSWLKAAALGQATTWFELWLWLKIINAALVAIGVTWLLVAISRRLRGKPMLVRKARLLAAILSMQLVLAGATWVVNYGWPAWFAYWVWPLEYTIVAQGRWQVLLTTAHAAVGSLTLAMSLSLAIWMWRLLRGAPP